MKKHLQFYAVLFIIPFAAFLFMSQVGGPIAGVTGSPKDVVDCTGCHQLSTTADFNASLEITTDITSGGYALGQTYNITVTQTSTGASKYGFEITAEDNSTSDKVGVFTPTDWYYSESNCWC